MKKLTVLSLSLAGAVLAVRNAQADIIYDNIPATTIFLSGGSPRVGGADDCNAPTTGDYRLTSFTMGYSVASGGPAAFDARIRLWDDFASGGAATPQFLNLVADFVLPFTGQTAGAWLSGPVSLASAGNPLIHGGDWAFQVGFYVPGTSTPVPNNGVTYIFDGSGVNVGSSDDVYWRDAANDGIIQISDARSFGGGATLANFVLQFEGDLVPVPEPSSIACMGIVGAAAVGTVIRRKLRKN
jgi:hypothetical protein